MGLEAGILACAPTADKDLGVFESQIISSELLFGRLVDELEPGIDIRWVAYKKVCERR